MSAPVTVVGAGLVGSLLSIFLAKRGLTVEIFERRPDMRRERINAGRSINLAVSVRGLHALRQVGLEGAILKSAIPMRGRMIHSKQGELTFQPYGCSRSDCIYSISRGGLNQELMTAAEATGKVAIRFRETCESVDFETGTTGFSGGSRRGVVFGTDGSASVIRSAMQRAGGHACIQDQLDYGYKELLIPAKQGGGFHLEPNALHIWPRGNFMLIALPNWDGTFTCTLFLPFRSAQGPSFENLHCAANVEEFFAEQFPDAEPLFADLTETFFGNPTGAMVTVKSAPWHVAGKALLLGDAAHAIVPFFGQGMNCGFEDCTVLDALMEWHGRDWETIFPLFSEARKPNADAIADLAVENFVEMRDKVAQPRFQLEKAVERLLQDHFPGDYVTRYSLVTFSRVPYRLALEAGLAQNEILAELCHGLRRAEDVDLVQAKALIASRLKPVLKGEQLSWT